MIEEEFPLTGVGSHLAIQTLFHAHPHTLRIELIACFALFLNLSPTWKCCLCGKSICETGTRKLVVTVSVCCLPRLKQETEVAPSVFLEQALPVSASDTQEVQVVSLPQSTQLFVYWQSYGTTDVLLGAKPV